MLLPSSCILAGLFLQKHHKYLTSDIYFHLDDSELRKQYQSVSQEMTQQVCDLETVQQQEIPIKTCVAFCNIEICYRGCGEKASFVAII